MRLRFAAVFQGGGIRGLFFPGHVFGLLNQGVTKIGAYSGTSAGALIAVALWAGLLPKQISDELERRSSGRFGLLLAIFSPYDILWSCIEVFRFPFAEGYNLAVGFAWRVLSLHRWLGPEPWRFRCTYGCQGDRFEALINELIFLGLRERQISDRFILDILKKEPRSWLISFRDIYELVYWIRLVNAIRYPSGDDFQQVLNVYKSIEIKVADLVFQTDSQGQSSNNIFELIYGRQITVNTYFFPLFISVCDIDARQPLTISSLDEAHLDIPIARAVRASAGFPLVFSPRPIPFGEDKTVLCTDGGLFYNLPTISLFRDMPRQIRGLLEKKHIYIEAEEHRDLLLAPLTIIGLSTEDSAGTMTYAQSLFAVLSGGGRNFLERKLAEYAPYLRHITQKAMINELYFLNFLSVNQDYVASCFRRGEEQIKGNGFPINLTLADCRDRIVDAVQEICIAAHKALCKTDADYVRAHFFVEGRETQGLFDKKMFCYLGQHDRQFNDERQSMATRTRHAGIVGQCILSGRMIVGRLDFLQDDRCRSPADPVLNLSWAEVTMIPSEVRLCLAIPIFDFRQLRYQECQATITPLEDYEDRVVSVDCGIAGPLVGILSIDSNVNPRADLSRFVEALIADFHLQTLERLTMNLSVIISSAILAQNRGV